MQKLLNFILALDNLSRIPRTGGVLFAGIDPNSTDSLAEHSFKTAYLCFLLGKLSQKRGLKINLGELVLAAVSHDWVECVLMDAPFSSPSYKSFFKDTDLGLAYKKAEEQVTLEMREYLKPDIELSDDDFRLTEAERNLLSISDTTALLTEILEWKFEGMQYDWFNYVWANSVNRLKKYLGGEFEFLNDLVLELEKLFSTGVKPVNPFLTKPQHQTLKK